MDHMDELRRRDQLLSWGEQGLLTPTQLKRALAPATSAASAAQWRWALDRLLGFYGCLLLALGVIFFFAFNWDELNRGHKLAAAALALSGFAVAAFILQSGSAFQHACLFGAALTTGALLALIGQIYQTGADIWQLFAGWSALMLPWVLLSRSAASWMLLWLVVNLAVLRYFAVHAGWLGSILTSASGLLAAVLTNLLLLLVFEMAGGWLLLRPGRLLHRLCGLALVAALTVGGCIGWWQHEYRELLVGLLLAALIGLPVYLRRRPDLFMVAILAYSLVVLTAAGLIRLLDPLDGFGVLQLVGIQLLASSAAVSVWLHRLYREANA